MKKILILIITVATLVILAFIAYNQKTKTSLKYENQQAKEVEKVEQDKVSQAVNKQAESAKPIKINSEILNISKNDLVLGDANAPITMIEYASLSCPHCAAFYREAFYKLKEEYIDTGKVKFIYRDFPLNQPALAAAMTAFCRADDENKDKIETYHKFIKALFKTQDSWAFDPKYIEKLEAIAMLDGMSVKRFKSCLEDKKLQTKILEARMAAAKSLQLHSTPTFYINGEIIEGYVDYHSIKKVIDKNL